jgi:hypothetical protein
MTTQRHTDSLPQGTTRIEGGIVWTLGTDAYGEVWIPASAKAGKVRYAQSYRDSRFEVGTIGCKDWKRAVAYSIKTHLAEYQRAKAIVAKYEAE